MPDDKKQQDFHTFDREPATGSVNHDPETTEHADLKHRLEAEPHDEPVAPRTTETIHSAEVKPAPAPPAPLQQASPAVNADELPHPGPGMLVLQWLVYALWGWTVLALSGLVVVVVSQLLRSDDTDSEYGFGNGISYLLAAVIVLFIISLACDLFYAKAERKHAKTTGSNVIMIIHAVLFSLFGIGALISSVFGAVQLMVGDTNDTSGAVSTIISGAIIFMLYGLTLLRTLRPMWLKGVVRIYWALMIAAIAIFMVLGVTGPAQQARARAYDRVLEGALPAVVASINEYVSTNGSLPKDIQSLEVESLFESPYGGDSDEFKDVIQKGLIEYKPGEKLATTGSMKTMELKRSGLDQLGGTEQSVYHYQLCVTYKTSYGSRDSYGNKHSSPESNQRYDTYISTYGHKAGNTCYDLQTENQY